MEYGHRWQHGIIQFKTSLGEDRLFLTWLERGLAIRDFKKIYLYTLTKNLFLFRNTFKPDCLLSHRNLFEQEVAAEENELLRMKEMQRELLTQLEE